MKLGLRLSLFVAACTFIAATASAQQRAVVVQVGNTVSVSISGASAAIDFANAKPMPFPMAARAPSAARSASLGPSGGSPGGQGTGQQNVLQLVPASAFQSQEAAAPEEYGTSNHVYTTSKVNNYGQYTASYYPYRAAGKLFFLINGSSFVCSASMIKPGIIVTAAHCVANFGASQFYSGWTYVPSYNNGLAPYGTYTGVNARILTSYFNGTDSCAQAGVICVNDVALVSLNANAGNATGWFGYGYGGYSYSGIYAEISQLGYPVSHNSGAQMMRTDSYGYVSSGNSNNTIIGSLQTGGSSGGPWVVNLGMDPILSGTSFGTGAAHNIVVGVTSWGYINTAVKEQGASPFTSGNIQVLVTAECGLFPSKC